MKQKKWLWILAGLAVVEAIALILAFRPTEPEYLLNHKIPYICMEYRVPDDLDLSAEENWNLLDGVYPEDNMSTKESTKIISSMEELEPILARAACKTDQIQTADLTFDEEFFEQNALLLVDISIDDWEHMRARPENLKEKDGTVTVTVCWDMSGDSSCNGVGTLMLIPVSANCTKENVTCEGVNWLYVD